MLVRFGVFTLSNPEPSAREYNIVKKVEHPGYLILIQRF